ncbi:MAG: NERD domain-containing protein [Candidatus Bathyarchaeota archaeon]|nr:NERD domain-containing protein [Candidatus Bathyarchaeota archaeon]
MSVEREVLISLLKLTQNGAVLIENVNNDIRLPRDVIGMLLEKFQNDDLLNLQGGVINITRDKRLKMAVKAVSLGADVERVSSFLRWQEFEDVAAVALEKNGYRVVENVRFKHEGKRWEIDVVGCKKPLVVCIDCKHWSRVAPSALKRIVDAQMQRVQALAESLPNIAVELECAKWDKAKFVPVVLSLMQTRFKFYDNVPIVPVLQLQDFLSQLPAYTESLKYFLKDFNHLA